MEKKKLRKVQSGLFRIIFSRTGLVLVMILLQIGLFVVSMSRLQQYSQVINGFFRILGIIVLIYIINSEDNPAFKMTWMLCVMAFPAIGSLFYVYVKSKVGTRWVRGRLRNLKLEERPYMQQDRRVLQELKEEGPGKANLAAYLSSQMHFPVYKNTEITYFPLGEDKMQALYRELEKAEHYIFLEYFIVAEGHVWDTVLDILKRKADEGVEVRFMYDGMCAISNFPYYYYKKIRKMGIQCRVSNPIIPFLSTVQNSRDHRKICVIDGKVAFTGGVNLADEYANEITRFGHWKDTAIMLKGDAVQSFTMLFLEMWAVNQMEPADCQNYTDTEACSAGSTAWLCDSVWRSSV